MLMCLTYSVLSGDNQDGVLCSEQVQMIGVVLSIIW